MSFEALTMLVKARLCAMFILLFGLSACGGWTTHASSQSARKADGNGFVGKALAESAAEAHQNDIENWCDGHLVQDDRDAKVLVEDHNRDGHAERNIEHKIEAAHKCQ